MKNYSKLIIVATLVAFTSASFAQTFGFKTGLNLSNIKVQSDDDGLKYEGKMIPGFHLGTTAEFIVSKSFSFETGILVSTKGLKENADYGDGNKINAKVTLYYLDIPLNAKGSFEITGGKKLFYALGPYIGIGLYGNDYVKETYDGLTEKSRSDIKWGTDEDEDDLKRLDYGLSFGTGVELKAISLGVSYSLGLANISPYTEYGFKMTNRVLAFSLGYKFGKK